MAKSKAIPEPGEASKEYEAESESDRRNSPTFWLKWIKGAKTYRPRERHIRSTSEAWREYNKDTEVEDVQYSQDNQQRAPIYPAYKFAIDTAEPALYSRTPDIVTERRFDINDPVSNTMSLIAERLGEYLMHNSNFDDVMNMAVADYFHAAKTTTQVIYDAALRDVRKTIQLVKHENSEEYLTEDGSPYPQENPVMMDPMTGMYSGEIDAQEVIEESQKLYLAPATYDEILHTPSAKYQFDINEIAYYFCYTKEEAEMKFDEAALEGYPWRASPNTGLANPAEKKEARPTETADKYMDGWEIWCKISKTVYWVSEGAPGKFLKEPKKDPYGLKHFFPSPSFILQGKPSKNMFPTPNYVHLRPTLMQLHLMYERVFGLIDSVRRRAIVDGDADVIAALNGGDQEFISAKSLKGIVEKGGLNNMIWYIPVQELVAAITELNALEDRFTDNFEKWFGVPDIVQGVSDPIETLGAQEIKANAQQDRFKNAKKKVQQLARDSIEMMVDLALKVFSYQKIARICGYEYMEEGDKQRFPQALATLRDDEERTIRIGIDTDSMTFVDQGLKNQRLNAAINTVTNGLKQATDMMQINTEAGVVAMQTVLAALSLSDVGKKFSDGVKASIDSLIKKAQEPLPPPPPPQPSPDVLAKIQSEQQIAMQKMQLDQEYRMAQLRETQIKNQTDANLKVSEIQNNSNLKAQDQQIKIMDIQERANAAAAKTQSDAYYWEQENQISFEQNQITRESNAARTQIEMMNAALSDKVAQTQATLDALQLKLDKQRDDFAMMEKIRDDARLERQQVLDHIQNLTSITTKISESPKAVTSAAVPSLPAINIHMPKSKKRVGKITTDEKGNPSVEISDAEDPTENKAENGVEE